MVDEHLTRDFALSEFIRSDVATRRGYDNTPPPKVLENIRRVLAPGMQAIRDILGKPVHITSGYRSPLLNAVVGGARNSQHVLGLAADFVVPRMGDPYHVCNYLLTYAVALRWDQLIFEGEWVHIGFATQAPRGQVLTAHFKDGRASYLPGLVKET